MSIRLSGCQLEPAFIDFPRPAIAFQPDTAVEHLPKFADIATRECAPILAASPELPELVANAPELEHPEHFFGAPVVPELTGSDWAILVADFASEVTAQTLAAMLNHLAPPIPARKVEKDGSYQVIAGPFKNQKEAELAAHRIKMDFGIEPR